MSELTQHIREKFLQLYHREPLIVRSPGRINLIGEHTDYNDGFVMPAAIDKEAVFAIAPSSNESSSIYAIKFDEVFEVDIESPHKVIKPSWANYLLGVLYKIINEGYQVKPFNCVFGGDVPVGAGLSSSAAVECGFGFALSELNGLSIPKLEIVSIAQWAEHNYAGVKCGIMDQFASVMGRDGHVVLLDCRSMEFKYLPIDLSEYSIILCDSKVKHSLVDSEYNTRREECEKGVSLLMKGNPKIRSLRDVSSQTVKENRTLFPGKVYDRCLYVTQEIERVQQASEDLQRGDLISFGKKMYETHDGLSRLYEVSCPELDFLVELARSAGCVIGSRMMGGGFGGCTINLVRKENVEDFEKKVRTSYRDKYGIETEIYRVKIREGTGVVSAADQRIVNAN